MPRTLRNARLENLSRRLALARNRYHWTEVDRGVALGYRRGKRDYGTWTARVLEAATGAYWTRRLGVADDNRPADGAAVLDYYQASAAARTLARPDSPTEALARPYTVEDAVRDYLAWFELHRKSKRATETALRAHVTPKLGRRPLAELSTRELRTWHEGLAKSAPRRRTKRKASAQAFGAAPDTPEALRRRKATANRLLNVLRAVLNHAWREGKVAADLPWRRVRPFPNASEPRVRYLATDEARRLLNAAASDLERLARAALLTGCRYGELAALRVQDYLADVGSVFVRESKSGKPRHVPLTREGVALFDELTAGRKPDARALLRSDGTPWEKNYQVRPLEAACTKASIAPAVSFHILRHTYASWLAMRGVPLQVIAEALGHADTRITQKHYGHLAPSYVAEVIRKSLPALELEHGNVRRLASARERPPKRVTASGA